MDVNSELKSKTPSSAEISKADFSKVFFESGAKTTHKLEVKGENLIF
jgi:ribosomal protein L25 (general stress protein Ctc)